MTEAEIFNHFAAHGIKTKYGELYLPKAKALDFITACEENGLAIIGIEGFIIVDDSILPQTDLIADYSPSLSPRGTDWIDYSHRCNTAVLEFVQRANSQRNLYFTFVVMSY